MYELRSYQKKAVEAGMKVIKANSNGVIVLPTAAGKSLVIAEIVKQSQARTVVLQPTKEILEQNLEKIRSFGTENVGVFSASMNKKTVGYITLATIGSIVRHKEKFAGFELIIIDECDLANAKAGQYKEFIEYLDVPVIGVTATPFRMKYYRNSFGHNEPVVESRFLTRTRPRLFKTIAHITQIPDMFKGGYLCPIKYDMSGEYDSRKIRSNSTGQGYVESALLKYNQEQKIILRTINAVKASKSKHKLIFMHFREESKTVSSILAKAGVRCEEISGKTKKHDRARILSDFREGKTHVVNVGVLVAGFDFPALDHIIIARPTKSLRLYTQVCGRGLRIAEGKKHCIISDLCDNVKRFGEINSFVIEDISEGRELWRLKSNKGYLTGVNLQNGRDLEEKQMLTAKEKKLSGELMVSFGKYKGVKVSELDEKYMEWCVENFDAKNKWKRIFAKEVKRRNR